MLADLANLFFPHVCVGCSTDALPRSSLLCPLCLGALPATGFLPLEDNPVEKIFYGRVRIAAAGSLFYFSRPSVMQEILFALKYHRQQETGMWLGRLLGQQLQASGRFTTLTAIVPVPLHSKKQRKRGYNQSQLIAEGVAAVCQLPVWSDVVHRTRFTDTQTQLTREERLLNLQNAFMVAPVASLEGSHLLLVDDVITTGATLEACAIALRQAGATISIATVARAVIA